ncbi:MAG: MarR family winged helix-turn-helix transcriptional regulator [Acidimicrobiales bacterium]
MDEPRWLDEDEQATWQAYLASTRLLEETLDRQLQNEAGMPHTYYGILAQLSDAPDQRMRMSDLARLVRASPSRMTHAITSLENRGWVRREQCPTDKRGYLAVLEPAGRKILEEKAPGHVAEVRARLFDRLTPEQVVQLRQICEGILEGLDTSDCPSTVPGSRRAVH